MLRRFFVNKVPRDLVDDLVQETFLECLGALKTFEGRASLRTFIILIAKRRCYKYYRTRDRKLAHLDPLEDSVEAMSTGLFTKLARQLDQRLLLTALRRIPLKYQTAIELFYWEGLSIREASEVLDGMNERTFRTWLRVGKEKLMEELSRDGVTDEMRRESFRALRTMQAEVKTEGAA